MTVSLRLLVIKTHDPSGVAAFYQSLGLQFAEEQHGTGPVHYAARVGDGVLEIYPLQAAERADSTLRLGLAVDDVDEAVRGVAALGGRVVRNGKQTTWGYQAIVADPDGRTVELVSD